MQHHHELCAQCPACGLHELVPALLHRDADGIWRQQIRADEGTVVQIDVCPVCFGAWFDRGELAVLGGDQPPLEDALELGARPSRRPCPHGHGLLDEHALRGLGNTHIDHCHVCHGIWLDGQERRKLARVTTSEGQGTRSKRWLVRGAIWAAQVLTSVPVEVDNPARGTPRVVYALLAAFVVVFVAQLTGFVDTYAFGLVPGRLNARGDVDTLLSYMFLHGSWGHLLGNAYFLYAFGDNIEHLFGTRRFAAFFLACGVMGALAHAAITYETAAVVVGASGAIAGVLAAYLWAFPRQRLFQVILMLQLKIPVWAYLGVWIAFHLVMTLFATGGGTDGVAWLAHLGGFALGLAVTPFILRLRRVEVARRVRVPWLGHA